MRFVIAVLGACAFAFFAAAAPAEAAGPTRGQLGLNLAIGQDIPVNGAMHNGIDNSYADLAPLFAALAGQEGRVIINSRAYDDFYGATPLYQLALSYAAWDNLEFFLGASHTEGDSDLVQIGSLASPAAGTPVPLYARFSPYRSTALELGARAWLGERSNRFRPYAAFRIGGARTDAISATMSAPGVGSGETIVPFYNETNSVTVGVDFGVAYEVARLRALNASIELGAEIGFRYTTELDEDDSTLGAINAADLNNRSGRTSAPVLLTMRMRFGGSDQRASRY